MSDMRNSGLVRSFRTYVDILLFRKGPEDLPASPALLVLTIGANVILELVLGSLVSLPGQNRLITVAAAAAFVLAWYWALLRLAGRPERLLQTATAIFGFQTVLMPAFVLVMGLVPDTQDLSRLPLPATFLFLALAIWTLAVTARIVRAATEWPQFACIAVVLLQALVGQIVLLGLFPDAATRVGGAAG